MSSKARTNLLLRESLKFDKTVLAVLNRLWDVSDEDKSGGVTKGEYMSMMRVVFSAVNKAFEGTKKERDEILEQDWEFDSHGDLVMNKRAFLDCWFQVADRWTESVNAKEYARFLGDILECTTKLDKNGRRVWRREDKVHDFEAWRQRKERRHGGKNASDALLQASAGGADDES